GLSGTLSQLSLDKTYKITLDGIDNDNEVIATLSFALQSGSLIVAGDVKTTDGVSECFSGLQVRCPSHDRCVSPYWICDGSNDCPDGADEQGCLVESCDGFSCWGDICIPATWRCDGHEDCKDGDDEYGCGECGPKESLCPTGGTCVPANATCDGYNHCPDGWDESAAVCDVEICSLGEHPCGSSGRCVAHELLCDSISHCPEGEDEEQAFCNALKLVRNLPDLTPTSPAVVPANIPTTQDSEMEELDKSCLVDEWSCVSGQCIGRLYLCDGYRDCVDGTDETEDACAQAHLDMAEAIQKLAESNVKQELVEDTILQSEDEISIDNIYNDLNADAIVEEDMHNSLIYEDSNIENDSVITEKDSVTLHENTQSNSEVNEKTQTEIFTDYSCDVNQILCYSGECAETYELCKNVTKEEPYTNDISINLDTGRNNFSNIYNESETLYQIESEIKLDVNIKNNESKNEEDEAQIIHLASNTTKTESKDLSFINHVEIDVEVQIEVTDNPTYVDIVESLENLDLDHHNEEDVYYHKISNEQNELIMPNMTLINSTEVITNISSNNNSIELTQTVINKDNSSADDNSTYTSDGLNSTNTTSKSFIEFLDLSELTNKTKDSVNKTGSVSEYDKQEYDYQDFNDYDQLDDKGDSFINCTEFLGNPWDVAIVPDFDTENSNENMTNDEKTIIHELNTNEQNTTEINGNPWKIQKDLDENDLHLINVKDESNTSDIKINNTVLFNGDVEEDGQVLINSNHINNHTNIVQSVTKSINDNVTLSTELDNISLEEISIKEENHNLTSKPKNRTVLIAIQMELANENLPQYVIQGYNGHTYEYEIINIHDKETNADTQIDQ
ncbi:unnamed protein product, partial [Meganyctiphanes norvegica]